MKFARLSSLLREISVSGTRNGSHSNFYSSKEHRSVRQPSEVSISELYHRIFPIRDSEAATTELCRRISPTGDPKVSILPTLNQWVEDGRPVDREILLRFIKELRSYKRYHHALEVSIWMTDKGHSNLTSSDVITRLDLIKKTRGIEQAEKYFNDVIPQELKVFEVYLALFKCYETAGCVEKSEAVIQKMRDLGFSLNNTVNFNRALNFYYKTGNMEKFNALSQEMEESEIVRNSATLKIQLSAYAAVMDIGRMDKVVSLMESDPKVVFDWTSYTTAAAGYTKAGLLEKAFEMLKKAEACIPTKGYPTKKDIVTTTKFVAYNNLLTQYAAIGRKDEALRLWSLYEKKYRVCNKGYECILNSFLKTGDFEIAEQIFDEWESEDLAYDIQIPNIIIGAYCRKGLFDKAETLINRAISKGGEPNFWTWYCFAAGYTQYGQPEKAVEMLKKAIVLYKPGLKGKPNSKCLAACLEHLKGVGGMEEAEELIKLMSVKSIIPLDIQEKLLNAIKAKESVKMLELKEPEDK